MQDFAGGQVGVTTMMRGDRRSDVHIVYGAIRSAYIGLGGGPGTLGFPVTDQYAWCGIIRQDFVGGSIAWDATNGARQLVGNSCPGPVDRRAIVSYNRVAAGAPHHGYFKNA